MDCIIEIWISSDYVSSASKFHLPYFQLNHQCVKRGAREDRKEWKWSKRQIKEITMFFDQVNTDLKEKQVREEKLNKSEEKNPPQRRYTW